MGRRLASAPEAAEWRMPLRTKQKAGAAVDSAAEHTLFLYAHSVVLTAKNSPLRNTTLACLGDARADCKGGAGCELGSTGCTVAVGRRNARDASDRGCGWDTIRGLGSGHAQL